MAYVVQIAENDRAQQQMNILPAATAEYEGVPQFDSRNFLQVSLIEPNHHYSCQQQTALQLGYVHTSPCHPICSQLIN